MLNISKWSSRTWITIGLLQFACFAIFLLIRILITSLITPISVPTPTPTVSPVPSPTQESDPYLEYDFLGEAHLICREAYPWLAQYGNTTLGKNSYSWNNGAGVGIAVIKIYPNGFQEIEGVRYGFDLQSNTANQSDGTPISEGTKEMVLNHVAELGIKPLSVTFLTTKDGGGFTEMETPKCLPITK